MPETTVPREQDLKALLVLLQGFVEEEFSTQRRVFSECWERPLAELLAEGHCIAGLRFSNVTEDNNLRFTFQENDSNLREEDLVRVHSGDPKLPLFDANIVQDGDDFIDLRPRAAGAMTLIQPRTEYVVERTYADLERMVLEALEELALSARGRERILPLFAGDTGDELSLDAYNETLDALAGEGYNQSQEEAVAQGVAASHCCLIQGPPGTGKTRVLGQVVARRFLRGDRVLVTAPTHRAIHQALNAIHEALPGVDRIAKVGVPIVDPSLIVAQYETFAQVPFADADGAYIIGCTPYTARGKRMRGTGFDAVMFDEASQITLPLAVMAMLSGDTYVIIGDPQQLPPVVQSLPSHRSREMSIFNRLERQKDLIMLETTYRMNAEIAAWASERFYGGRLSTADRNAKRRLALAAENDQSWIHEALNPEQPLIWITRGESSGGRESDEEADVVNQLIQALFEGGIDFDQIGVVAPFRKQGRHIRRRLKVNHRLPKDKVASCVIDTVERMQGQEREVIIIATSAADLDFLYRIADFIYMPERLNVSVTRARSKAIVIAHDVFLDVVHEDAHIRDALDIWRSLRESSHIIRV